MPPLIKEEYTIMEKINIKILFVVVLLTIILGIGIFLCVKLLNNNHDTNYNIEKISEEDFKYFIVFTEGKYGVIDEKGNMIVKNEYTNIVIPNPTKPVFIVTSENNEKYVLNEKSEKIFEEFNNVQEIEINGTVTNLPYEKSVLKYEDNGKYGIIDFSGNIITKPIYEEIASVKYKEGEILAKKDGKYGVINNKGVELITFDYEEIQADKYYEDNSYSKSGYIVKKTTNEGYRYGYIDSNYKMLLNTQYTDIRRILDIDSNDTYLIVAQNGQYGMARNKNVEIDFAYQNIEYNNDTNLLKVEKNGQFGVLTLGGKTIVNIEYKDIKFNGIYIFAKSYTEEIYFNKNGEKVENSYTAMQEAQSANSYITVDKNNLYGIVDENGKETVKNEYLYIEYAFDKYFVAYKEGKGLGVIDNNGNIMIEFNYDVLSKVGEHKILRAIDMENNVTDIYSRDMEELISLSDVNLEVHDQYIEIYNDKSVNFITKEGKLKSAKEVLTNNKLFSLCKERKVGLWKCKWRRESGMYIWVCDRI